MHSKKPFYFKWHPIGWTLAFFIGGCGNEKPKRTCAIKCYNQSNSSARALCEAECEGSSIFIREKNLERIKNV